MVPKLYTFSSAQTSLGQKKTAQAAANNFRIKFYNLLRNKLGKICDGFLMVDSFQKKECVRHSANEKSK